MYLQLKQFTQSGISQKPHLAEENKIHDKKLSVLNKKNTSIHVYFMDF